MEREAMRLFLAVLPTRSFRAALVEGMEQLRRQGVRGTYTRPENLHLTLAFLGETTRLEEVRTAVEETVTEPFPIRPGTVGRFRDILWLGLEGEEQARALARAVREALDRHGIPYDRKPFKAHITLVRRAKGGELPELVLPAAEMQVCRVAIMRSVRVEGRLTYAEL